MAYSCGKPNAGLSARQTVPKHDDVPQCFGGNGRWAAWICRMQRCRECRQAPHTAGGTQRAKSALPTVCSAGTSQGLLPAHDACMISISAAETLVRCMPHAIQACKHQYFSGRDNVSAQQ